MFVQRSDADFPAREVGRSRRDFPGYVTDDERLRVTDFEVDRH